MLTRTLLIITLFTAACTPNPAQRSTLPQNTAESKGPSTAVPAPSSVVVAQPTEIPGTIPSPPAEDGLQKELTQVAINDLAARLTIGTEEISVIWVKSIVWPSAGLGCPTDQVYASEKTPGFQIRLMANKKVYEYHTDRTSQVILCAGTEPFEPGLR